MIKRLPSRNPRSKGARVKHVLQICLLLGVCFWLVYQIKHSHDKKKEYDEKETKTSARTQGGDETLKLGRKDLHPRIQDEDVGERHEADEEEETGVEEEANREKENKHQEREETTTKPEELQDGGGKHDEEDKVTKSDEEEREAGTKPKEEEREEISKHEEEDQEEESNTEETEEDGRGGSDDEMDERDQEIIEGEADHEEAFIDEEKEREEEGEEKENEGEEKETQVNDETPSEDEDHDDQTSHEAREEHYKADDASSAVTHDTQTLGTEPEKASSKDPNENTESNLELKSNSNNKDSMNSEDLNARKAQEYYKADDASSAVTHDTQVISTESEKTSAVDSNENTRLNDLEQKTYSNIHDATDMSMSPNNSTVHPQLVTAKSSNAGEQRDDKFILSNTEDKLPEEASSHGKLIESTDTGIDPTTGSKGIPTSKSNQTQNGVVDDATSGKEFQTTVLEQVSNGEIADGEQSDHNGEDKLPEEASSHGKLIEKSTDTGIDPTTGSKGIPTSQSTQTQNGVVDDATSGKEFQTTVLEQVTNGEIADREQSDHNSIIPNKTESATTTSRDPSNSSINSEDGASQNIAKPNIPAEAENSGSSTTNEATNASNNENLGNKIGSGGTDENSRLSTTNETGDANVHDSIDSSDLLIGQGERKGILPETGTEGLNNRAAE